MLRPRVSVSVDQPTRIATVRYVGAINGDVIVPEVLRLYGAIEGTVRNSVFGRAVKLIAYAIAALKRSPNMTANCDLAMDHSRGGIFHSFSDRFKTKNRSFIAASSVGKWPLARTARRSLEFKASMAFVV